MDTSAVSQAPSRVYFRPTTASQRRFLFCAAEEAGNVTEASHRARVSRGTYYYWRPRYESDGNAGLEHERSRAPHHTRIPPVSPELQAEVLAYHQAHLGEGWRSIANGIAQAHYWQPVIGYTKVREIILAECAADPPPVPDAPPVETCRAPAEAVHAPQPDQTLNVDICVVPLTHDGTEMPSVSLGQALAGVMPSDGERSTTAAEWPGQAFGNADLSYAEQMRDYAHKRTAKPVFDTEDEEQTNTNRPPTPA